MNIKQLSPEGEVNSGGGENAETRSVEVYIQRLVFVGAAASFTAKISSFKTVAKRKAILNPVPKTVNIQGYSQLREPIKTLEICYPLIWGIPIDNNTDLVS